MKEKNNILIELKSLAPSLTDLKNKDQFNAPSRFYFNDLQEKIFCDIRLEQFKTRGAVNDIPSKYFEKLPDIIINNVKKVETKVVVLKPYYKWAAVAAFIFVTTVISFLTLNLNSKQQIVSNDSHKKEFDWVNNLNEAEIKYFIDNFSNEEDLETIKNLDVNETELKTNIPSDQLDVLTDEEIEYLNEIM